MHNDLAKAFRRWSKKKEFSRGALVGHFVLCRCDFGSRIALWAVPNNGLNQNLWVRKIFTTCTLSYATKEAHFCAPAFSYVLRFKKGPFFVILLNFHSLEALKACLEACPDVFCSNFHGLATLEFKTCIEACLQLCFIRIFFWSAASSITLRS